MVSSLQSSAAATPHGPEPDTSLSSKSNSPNASDDQLLSLAERAVASALLLMTTFLRIKFFGWSFYFCFARMSV